MVPVQLPAVVPEAEVQHEVLGPIADVPASSRFPRLSPLTAVTAR